MNGDLTEGWIPKAEVVMHHSRADRLVPVDAYVSFAAGNVKVEWAPLDPIHVETMLSE